MNRQAYVGVAFVFCFVISLTSCNSSHFSAPTESIAATSGTPQSGVVTTAFAAPLVATVKLGGAPVSGASVTFTAPATGASGTFASNATATETDTTNADGVATSSAFTANAALGAYTVTASVAGVIASTNYSLTNTTGPPASVTVSSGTPQTASISTAFAAPLVVTVTDTYANPLSGVTVTFAAPATGASGTFASNSMAIETDTTNASGIATSSAFSANAMAGSYVVTATVSGVATAANFNLTNITGTLTFITATSGTPQSATVNQAFAAPLVATVVDGNSNPVVGAPVTFTAPATGASGTFASNSTATETDITDAGGVATSSAFTAHGAVGSYTVTAVVTNGEEPANFNLTNNPIHYAFYLSGTDVFDGGPPNSFPNYYALAGAVTADGNGNILGGEQDYNDAFSVASPEPSGDTITGGTLSVSAGTGQGTFTLVTNNTLVGVNGTETLAVQFVNNSHALIIQFDGTATSSGSLDLQTLPSTLSGGYAFALAGVDNTYSATAFGGVFSISGTSISNGVLDVNDSGSGGITTGTDFTATIDAADSFGRGAIGGFSVQGNPVALNYYIVGPEAIRIIDVDPIIITANTYGDSAVGSAFGQGASAFTNASLGSSVLALANGSNGIGYEYGALAQFSTSSTSSHPADFAGVGDDNELDNGVLSGLAAAISGTYSIAGNGYGSMTFHAPHLGSIKTLGIYLTDPALNLSDPNNTTGAGGGLALDLDAVNSGGLGLVVAQTDTASSDFAGKYAAGWQGFNYYNANCVTLGQSCEFDMVAQGSMTAGGALSLTGRASDPFLSLGTPHTTSSGDTFSGTPLADGAHPGRYTLLSTNPTPNPLATVIDGSDFNFNVIIYQASGGQLFWLNYDSTQNSVFSGPLEQQGSLTELPASRIPAANPRSRRSMTGGENGHRKSPVRRARF
jgi:hypothetical protein